jgi:hypothetical protein
VSHYELVVRLLLTVATAAQAGPPPEVPSSPTPRAEAEDVWDFSFSAYGYFYPDGSAYLQPTAAVDHGWLHLEGRYNDEALQTASLWLGWNFAWGEKLTFTMTPMVGAVFGKLNGVAPGLEWALAWGPLELYSDSEVVIDFADVEQSYFYAWSELSIRPLEWLRAGLALQRTRVHAEPRAVSWGPVIGFSVWKVEVDTYWFNPGQTDAQYWAVSVGLKL